MKTTETAARRKGTHASTCLSHGKKRPQQFLLPNAGGGRDGAEDDFLKYGRKCCAKTTDCAFEGRS